MTNMETVSNWKNQRKIAQLGALCDRMIEFYKRNQIDKAIAEVNLIQRRLEECINDSKKIFDVVEKNGRKKG